MKSRAMLVAAFASVLSVPVLPNTQTARAACICSCVDGQMTPICSSSIDVRPICPPRVCPIVPPRVSPIDPPRLPPLGATSCRHEQVYNDLTRQYEWARICR